VSDPVNAPPRIRRSAAAILLAISLGLTWLSFQWFVWARDVDDDENPAIALAQIVTLAGSVGGPVMALYCAYTLLRRRQ
jgi:multidrug resistance efflux pump